MHDKVKIRGKFLKIRANLLKEERIIKDQNIIKRLESLDVFKDATNVLFYYSVNGEVDTHELIERHLDSKQLYLPTIQGKSHFQAMSIKRPLEVQEGFYGIPEPLSNALNNNVNESEIEIIITPGVAFDKKGNRIGMGKGYYDRYFQSNKKSIKIALAYEEQILDSLPKDPYDESVDLIVTDQNFYQC